MYVDGFVVPVPKAKMKAYLGMAKKVRHPKIGEYEVVGQPIHLSRYPQPDVLRPTPDQGQHTDEVLREIGYDSNAIAGLRGKGVV